MSTLDVRRESATHPPLWPLGLAIALLLLLLMGLGRAPLFDVDEGAFSEATREMLASGDWGHTTLHGADRFDKPIGVYWLQALSATFFGLNEFALRLPSVLATWLAAMALWKFVMPRWNQRAGSLAAVIHTTAFGTWAMAHAATADALLGLFLMLSALDLWRYQEDMDLAALRRLGLWVGLGLLVKGPVALLIPACSLFLSCLSERQWKPLWRALSDALVWLNMLLVSMPWYAYAWWRHGQAFVDGFILRHNIERFAAPMEGHAGSWFYFLLVAPLLWMPWTPLLLALWGKASEIWRDTRVRRAMVWVVFVMLFFSISGTKLPHYGLYAAPGILILLVAALGYAREGLWRLCGGTVVMWHGLLVGVPLAWMLWPEWVPSALVDPLASTSARIPLISILAVWQLLTFALVVIRRRQGRLMGDVVVAIMAMLHAGVMALVVWPWWAQTLQGPIKVLAIHTREETGTVAQLAGHWPSFAFYRQQAMVKDHSQADMLLIPLQRSAPFSHWETVSRVHGMVLLRKPTTEGRP